VVGPTFRIAIAGFVDIAERTVVLLPNWYVATLTYWTDG